MESINKNQFIIIGKYWISKMIFMSYPIQLSVTNSETSEHLLLCDNELFKLLRIENLDAAPLHEYFDEVSGITKEKMLEYIRKFEEWEKSEKERKLMGLEDK